MYSKAFSTIFAVAMTTWVIGSEGNAIPSSFPMIGECSFPDSQSYDRYLETQKSYYPFEPVYGIQLFNETEDQRRDINHETNPYSENLGNQISKCPTDKKPSLQAPSNTASDGACPWEYEISYDPDRIPTTIGIARCLCNEGCLDPTTSKPRPDLNCRTVNYNMKVLRREGCSNGLYHYRAETMEVPVACACMRLGA